ncbi:hypothetical protein YYE_04983 [Plasmodium vinckei vinckei]|uniref:PIR protein CIR protein n=1 Tax=Plasmodium vinckei vinckei TaxID=54757 RepID=A0A081I909_PLAVN|nr:hypothetical protein YYE_04983 [Plasmodium vinckei vinckei]
MKFKSLIKRKSQYNHYNEYLLMWLSDKLFKIHIESIGKKNIKGYMDSFTLNQAYDKYLKNHKGILDYWVLLDMNQGLKEANLKYMSEFYKLLNHICKIITYYETKGVESREFSKNSIGCSRQYKTLYNNISECQSYLDLLNKLKGIYDDFRSRAIKNTDSKNDLKTKLQTLKTEDGKDMDAVRGFKTYDFSNEQCKFPKKKNTKPKKTNSPGLPPSSKEEPPPQEQKQDSPSPQEPQQEIQQSSSTTPPEDPPTKLELPSSSQESQELGKNNQNELTDPGKETGGSKSEIKGPEVEKGNMKGGDKELGYPSGEKGSQVNEGDRANSESGGEDTGKGGPEGGSTDKISETGDLDNGKGASKGGTGDVSGGDQKSPDGTSDLGSGAGGTSGGSGSDTDNQGGDTGGDKGSQDGLDGKEGERPTPNDSTNHQKHTSQTPSGTPHISSPSPDPKDQTNVPKLSQDSPKNQSSDQKDQGESKIQVETPVIKQENYGTKIKGNETTGIGDIYVLKKYKKLGTSIIVLLIPITLAIMYKYLSSGWRKELKKKTNMKKVINSIGGKKQIQIIIKSSNHKKNTKKSINSVYGEKSPSLNTYKIMQTDPMPFINLFFLLIFFVYKRKENFLEL